MSVDLLVERPPAGRDFNPHNDKKNSNCGRKDLKSTRSNSAPSLVLRSSYLKGVGSDHYLKKHCASICPSVSTNDRPVYLNRLSTHRAGAKFGFGVPSLTGPFIRSSQQPGPCSYEAVSPDKSIFQKPGAFSFGSCPRFGLGDPNGQTKNEPGPGHYKIKNPLLAPSNAGGAFSTAIRKESTNKNVEEVPGPGAYEQARRSTGGLTPKFTGRNDTRPTHVSPGPGHYRPREFSSEPCPPRALFGCDSRDTVKCVSEVPGPGAYQAWRHKALGQDVPKWSGVARRTQCDLNSYATPGPGAYNAVITFGPHS